MRVLRLKSRYTLCCLEHVLLPAFVDLAKAHCGVIPRHSKSPEEDSQGPNSESLVMAERASKIRVLQEELRRLRLEARESERAGLYFMHE